jgi:hypothetical protein
MYGYYGYSPYYFNALSYASNLTTAAWVGTGLTYGNNFQTTFGAGNVFGTTYTYGYSFY